MSTGKFVLSYTHLKDRPRSDQALPMLQKVASLVKPIMRKHSWVLPVLSEFFPESQNLVGELLDLHSTNFDIGSFSFVGMSKREGTYG
jgi:hypothetical protein